VGRVFLLRKRERELHLVFSFGETDQPISGWRKGVSEDGGVVLMVGRGRKVPPVAASSDELNGSFG